MKKLLFLLLFAPVSIWGQVNLDTWQLKIDYSFSNYKNSFIEIPEKGTYAIRFCSVVKNGQLPTIKAYRYMNKEKVYVGLYYFLQENGGIDYICTSDTSYIINFETKDVFSFKVELYVLKEYFNYTVTKLGIRKWDDKTKSFLHVSEAETIKMNDDYSWDFKAGFTYTIEREGKGLIYTATNDCKLKARNDSLFCGEKELKLL